MKADGPRWVVLVLDACQPYLPTGSWAEDDWQRIQFPSITPQAIANGIYMQPPTMKETVAVIAESLLEQGFPR